MGQEIESYSVASRERPKMLANHTTDYQTSPLLLHSSQQPMKVLVFQGSKQMCQLEFMGMQEKTALLCHGA